MPLPHSGFLAPLVLVRLMVRLMVLVVLDSGLVIRLRKEMERVVRSITASEVMKVTVNSCVAIILASRQTRIDYYENWKVPTLCLTIIYQLHYCFHILTSINVHRHVPWERREKSEAHACQ